MTVRKELAWKKATAGLDRLHCGEVQISVYHLTSTRPSVLSVFTVLCDLQTPPPTTLKHYIIPEEGPVPFISHSLALTPPALATANCSVSLDLICQTWTHHRKGAVQPVTPALKS